MLWHRGMSVDVCLAAMMPASCAVLSTLPLPTRFCSTSGYATGPSRTRHEARAERRVGALPDTSTMFAQPRSSTCVRRAAASACPAGGGGGGGGLCRAACGGVWTSRPATRGGLLEDGPTPCGAGSSRDRAPGSACCSLMPKAKLSSCTVHAGGWRLLCGRSAGGACWRGRPHREDSPPTWFAACTSRASTPPCCCVHVDVQCRACATLQLRCERQWSCLPLDRPGRGWPPSCSCRTTRGVPLVEHPALRPARSCVTARRIAQTRLLEPRSSSFARGGAHERANESCSLPQMPWAFVPGANIGLACSAGTARAAAAAAGGGAQQVAGSRGDEPEAREPGLRTWNAAAHGTATGPAPTTSKLINQLCECGTTPARALQAWCTLAHTTTNTCVHWPSQTHACAPSNRSSNARRPAGASKCRGRPPLSTCSTPMRLLWRLPRAPCWASAHGCSV